MHNVRIGTPTADGNGKTTTSACCAAAIAFNTTAAAAIPFGGGREEAISFGRATFTEACRETSVVILEECLLGAHVWCQARGACFALYSPSA